MKEEIEVLATDVEGLAKALNVGRTSAYELITSGEVPSFKIGNRRLIAVKSIEEYISRRLKGSTSERAA